MNAGVNPGNHSDEPVAMSGDEDTEGHQFKFADAEAVEGDDTDGHNFRGAADAEAVEGEEDAEGHNFKI